MLNSNTINFIRDAIRTKELEIVKIKEQMRRNKKQDNYISSDVLKTKNEFLLHLVGIIKDEIGDYKELLEIAQAE